ncbi:MULTISPECIES: hypothetical protein [Ornithinibacillus]|uniref:Uncharacterized protein n=2 Tax=Ornithinibacillus TaxID=484508 RepID=A0A923RHZ5_9BACI|nr:MULTISPECIES: hypothetical protein [Ornithinibacillus]MBC5636413.1 hypothetical protein [Ornithinibacillus hominis]MBS3680745.1 hypothetical protein [Ornithinibacillus massiliensis]
MPRRYTESIPHYDGKLENLLYQSYGTQIGMTSQVGMTTNINRNALASFNQIKDEKMKRFEEMHRDKRFEY